MHSFFPDDQGDGCDLARQSQTRHLRPHSLGPPAHRKTPVVIVIAVQPANLDRLLSALQLSIDTAMLGTAVGLDSEPDVRPELSLGTEPVRCLQERDDLSCPDRTDKGSRAIFSGTPGW